MHRGDRREWGRNSDGRSSHQDERDEDKDERKKKMTSSRSLVVLNASLRCLILPLGILIGRNVSPFFGLPGWLESPLSTLCRTTLDGSSSETSQNALYLKECGCLFDERHRCHDILLFVLWLSFFYLLCDLLLHFFLGAAFQRSKRPPLGSSSLLSVSLSVVWVLIPSSFR